MTAEVETPAPNVIVALSRVIRDMPGIGRDQKANAAQGGYAYRGIEAITREAAPLFAKHGVVFTPKLTAWHPRSEFTINNKPWVDERIEVTYRVYGPGGTEDFIDVGPIPAIGRDNADKASNKCMTQALKYALIQTLCIGDSKDDADGQTFERDEAPEMISSEQAKSLIERLDNLGHYPEPWRAEHLPSKKNMAYMTLADFAVADAILFAAELVGAGDDPPSEASDVPVDVAPASPAPDEMGELLKFSDQPFDPATGS